MRRCCCLLFIISLTGLSLHAQEWTKKDSLRLHQLLESEDEIILNTDAVNSIRLESRSPLPGNQLKMDATSPSLRFVEELKLPELPQKRIYLTLRPYSAFTRYNEDPVYGTSGQGSIMRRVNNMAMDYRYAHTSVRVGTSNLGAVFNQRNTRPENAFKTAGASIGGLDLMAPFTKKFWRKSVKADAWKTY